MPPANITQAQGKLNIALLSLYLCVLTTFPQQNNSLSVSAHTWRQQRRCAGGGGQKFHLLETLKGGKEWGQTVSYVIPKLVCNSCPCQEGGDNSPRRFKRWRQTETGGRGVQPDESLQIYSGTVNSTSTPARRLCLSLFERSLLFLITPLDVIILINNVWKGADWSCLSWG